MKRFYYLLAALGIAVPAGAKTINPSQAAGIAADFMAGKSIDRPSPRRVVAKSQNADVASPYYIYNYDGGGFVIVSGDDRFGDILAYNNAGAIDLASAPDGLVDILRRYPAAYEALPEGDDAAGSTIASAPTVVVEPLLGDITWGQDAPFNTMTPLSTGTTPYYTGCVACAATQIMRHYSYPAVGQGTKTYTDPASKNTLTADFGSTTYNWDLMPTVVPDNVTAAQTEAYSTLAAHFGIAVEMQYEAAGSGAYDMLVPYALRTYFGYDNAVRSHRREYYPTSEWVGMIKDELTAGRPVFYGGTSDNGGGGHAFVLDGYDSQDFFHVNWGWYGSSNGYFRINHLDPSSLGAGGGGGGYNLGQDMVTGIQPAQPGSKRDYALYADSRCSADGPFGDTFTMMTFVGNIDIEPFNGRVEGALVKDGKVVATLGGDNIQLKGFANGYSGSEMITLRSVASKVSDVPDGDYQMCFVFKGDDSDWTILRHPVNLPSYVNVKVTNGSISIVERHTPAPEVVQHSAFTTDGDLYAGGYGRATVTIESLSGDYDISEITLRLTGVDNPSAVFDAKATVSVYNQSVETVDVTFPVSADIAAGRYILSGLVAANGNEYPFDLNGFEATEVNVHAKPDAPVARLVATPTWQVNNATASVPDRLTQGENIYVTASFRNAGAPGTAKIESRLTNTATGETTRMIMAEANFVDDKSVSVIFSRAIPNEPGTYTLDFLQINDDYSMTEIVSLDEPLVITVDDGDVIVADVTSFEFPEHIAKGEQVPYSLEVVGRKTVKSTLYVRLRQLNNRSGEIVNMKMSTPFEPGKSVAVSGNYRPGSSLEDGLYMVVIEIGSSSASTPAGNYSLYAKPVAIGDVSGVDLIEAAKSAVAIWVEGDTLRVVPADGQNVKSVEIYTASGMLAAANRYDLSSLGAGIYLVAVTLDNGTRTVAKIAVK